MSGSLEEQVEVMMKEMRGKSWTAMIKQVIETLENEGLEKCNGNKLCKAKIMAHLIFALTKSLHGWTNWLNFDSMDNLTDEEIDDVYAKLKKLVIEFLELDMEITKKKEDELLEKKREEILKYVVKAREDEAKGKKKSGSQPEFYVA